ncbi:helix-turn-helix domain-containing protein [Haloarchaeobius amylolyticus]|uniref:Helix-turn-helix domain-containing protein n=1 Tax=Haloarchaeobius amylolyticus TaxID=1198296 RepID=A0ABD6BLV1_9EURY
MMELTHDTDPAGIPSELDSAQAKLVYFYLEASEGATATDLHQSLGLPKLAILSVINSLASQGLVEQLDAEYVTADSVQV